MFVLVLFSLGLACLVIGFFSCPARPGAGQGGRRGCGGRRPNGVTPLLVLMVGALLMFGLWGIRTHRSHRFEPDPWPVSVQRSEALIPPPLPKGAAGSDAEPGEPSWPVTGLGKTREDADQDALEKAQTEVINYLRQQDPSSEWTPPLSLIKKSLVKDRKEEEKEFPEAGRMFQVTLQVSVTPAGRSELVAFVQHARMEQRMFLLAKVLGGLLAIFLAVAGYIRLDEWSKGYCTGWLRLAAISLVAAALGGLWLFAPS